MRKTGLHLKLIFVILTIAVILTTAAAVIGYRVYSDVYTAQYKQISGDLVSTAVSLCSKDDLSSLSSEVREIYDRLSRENEVPRLTGKPEHEDPVYFANYANVISSEKYRKLVRMLEVLRDNNHILYIYACVIDPDIQKIIYLADGDGDGECLPGDTDELDKSWISKLRNADNIATMTADTPKYGRTFTTAVPVLNDRNQPICHICVDISMNEIMRTQTDFLFSMLIILMLLMIPLTMLILHVSDRALIRPVRQLNDAVSDFVSGKKGAVKESKISQLSVHTGDEIEQLADSVREMEQDINSYISEITEFTSEKERIAAEMEIATRIQSDALPRVFPPFPENPEIDIYAVMVPAKEVGGDFYDFFRIDEKHIAVVIGDASGKGIPGALFMMITKALIKDEAMRSLSPKDVLEKVNRQLCENNETRMFTTVWLGILEPASGRLAYANAGHEYEAYKSAGDAYRLRMEKHGIMLGAIENQVYREHETILAPGDRLFLYTDGVTEAAGENGEMFGTDRILEALNDFSDASVTDTLLLMKKRLDAYAPDSPQNDDITMISLLYRGKEQPADIFTEEAGNK